MSLTEYVLRGYTLLDLLTTYELWFSMVTEASASKEVLPLFYSSFTHMLNHHFPMRDMEARGPRYIMVHEHSFVIEESILRGSMLASLIGASYGFLPWYAPPHHARTISIGRVSRLLVRWLMVFAS
ncbi:hypothetical protein ACLOJK_022645 [Asimina triloba]